MSNFELLRFVRWRSHAPFDAQNCSTKGQRLLRNAVEERVDVINTTSDRCFAFAYDPVLKTTGTKGQTPVADGQMQTAKHLKRKPKSPRIITTCRAGKITLECSNSARQSFSNIHLLGCVGNICFAVGGEMTEDRTPHVSVLRHSQRVT